MPHLEVESDPLFYDRFKREEEIGKKLDHHGVMRVFDDDDRSRVYMVMEWVEGRPLRHVLTEQKKLPAERAVRIAIEICAALDHVHSQGLVHRDLKPENIMVDLRRPHQTDRFRHCWRCGYAAADIWEVHSGYGYTRLRISGAGKIETR